MQLENQEQNQSPKRSPNYRNLMVDTSHRQNKEIDSRWTELKFNSTFTCRSYFASCIQAGNIYIHGGFSSEQGILKDMYTVSMHEMPLSWNKINIKTGKLNPGGLRNHTLSSYLSNLILVGGQRDVIENNDQIYRFNLLNSQWTLCKCVDINNQPFKLALDSHSAVIIKNNLYIIYGYDAKTTKFQSNVIKISLEEINENVLIFQVLKTVQNEPKPSPRSSMSVCAVQDQIYFFGGGDIDSIFGDFWKFDLQQNKWTSLKEQNPKFWPQKRKGQIMVVHEKSHCIFMFGGIKQITKEQNDILVYIIAKGKWIKIHSSTNEVYDPSPTLKKIQESSPTILEEKRKRNKANSFKLGVKAVSCSQGITKLTQTSSSFKKKAITINPQAQTSLNFKKKMSVLQEKKYKDFLNRKKKLLNNIESQSEQQIQNKKHQKRSYSPTSQALIFSLNCMGEQTKTSKNDFNLPKVIFDHQKCQVIGKKPCARDGHAGLVYEESIVIIGGDRHMVSFNDSYLFKMDKGVETIQYYDH